MHFSIADSCEGGKERKMRDQPGVMGGKFKYILSLLLYGNATLAIGLKACFICLYIYRDLGSLFKTAFWENLIKMKFPSL